MGRIHPQNQVPSRQISLEGFKEYCSFHIRALRDGTMAECVQDSCEFSLFDKIQNERHVWKYDSHGI